jgi:hypothetical protein
LREDASTMKPLGGHAPLAWARGREKPVSRHHCQHHSEHPFVKGLCQVDGLHDWQSRQSVSWTARPLVFSSVPRRFPSWAFQDLSVCATSHTGRQPARSRTITASSSMHPCRVLLLVLTTWPGTISGIPETLASFLLAFTHPQKPAAPMYPRGLRNAMSFSERCRRVATRAGGPPFPAVSPRSDKCLWSLRGAAPRRPRWERNRRAAYTLPESLLLLLLQISFSWANFGRGAA